MNESFLKVLICNLFFGKFFEILAVWNCNQIWRNDKFDCSWFWAYFCENLLEKTLFYWSLKAHTSKFGEILQFFHRRFYVLSEEKMWSSLSLWLIYIFCKCFSLWSSSASDLASERGLWFSLRRRRGVRLGTNLNRTSDRKSEKTDKFLTTFWPTYYYLSYFWLLGVSEIRPLYVARG